MAQTPTILVVDDDQAYRAAFSSIFRDAGFGVREASTGKEGLRLARLNPDVVVMDVNLPDLKGAEFCRRIKMHPATDAIPVLHLSEEYTSSQSRARGLEEGADATLPKPVEAEELLAHVKALLRIRE